jgi:hypothetical protein
MGVAVGDHRLVERHGGGTMVLSSVKVVEVYDC